MMKRSPNICIAGRIHRRHIAGMGMGSVLLNKGGTGSGSSYPSLEAYKEAVRGPELSSASGLGGKIQRLVVKPIGRKPKNISFEM